MSRRDIVTRYIFKLEQLYKERYIWNRAEKLARLTLTAKNEGMEKKYFTQFDELDKERIRYMRSAEKLCRQTTSKRNIRMVSITGVIWSNSDMLENLPEPTSIKNILLRQTD